MFGAALPVALSVLFNRAIQGTKGLVSKYGMNADAKVAVVTGRKG
jgi:hypothetical protein